MATAPCLEQGNAGVKVQCVYQLRHAALLLFFNKSIQHEPSLYHHIIHVFLPVGRYMWAYRSDPYTIYPIPKNQCLHRIDYLYHSRNIHIILVLIVFLKTSNHLNSRFALTGNCANLIHYFSIVSTAPTRIRPPSKVCILWSVIHLT